MNLRPVILLLVLSCLHFTLNAQTCTTLGQNPETAFPVCGTTSFHQDVVPACGGNVVVAPTCTALTLTDVNPYWYKFTCFSTGTLAFTIIPNNPADDYDWQLFDITNRSPREVYTDNSLFVACNWSGESGTTGASSAGNSLIVCGTTTGSPYRPLFSAMPTLLTGHNYLLLISHFTANSQSGYSLSFGGGTADITDPVLPHLASARGNCDGSSINIQLNKKMKCRSLALDGSDFSINAVNDSIISATGIGCAASFDMNELTLTLSNPLPPGNYIITIKKGSDGNTLLDNCDRPIPVNESIPLTILPLLPTPMDSLTTPKCAPQILELVFRKPIKCSSIAADGSDFLIIGPYPVTVSTASGNCNGGLSSSVFVSLSSPLLSAGDFIIRLKSGSDGNTLIDECSQETPAGSQLPFNIKDTVNADFTYNIIYGCQRNTVRYIYTQANGVNSWQWNFDNLRSSDLQNPVLSYASFTQKNTTLIVSNGVCSDTATKTIFFDNYLDVKFEAATLACPGDNVLIKNRTIGNIVTWQWQFGNGMTSNIRNPQPQVYTVPNITYTATIKLIATNNFGCSDSAFRFVKIINNCFIAVPSAFTPNSDGLNDYLYPLNAYKAANLHFSVYNRFGQLMFFTADWNNKWDGRFKGQDADPGTYVWILDYLNTETNRRVQQKGSSILIR